LEAGFVLKNRLLQHENAKGSCLMPRKRASDTDAKLNRASEMEAQGKTQKEIAAALGISVMTLHRWRKSAGPATNRATSLLQEVPAKGGNFQKIAAENALLRKLVTDMLLENMRLKQSIENPSRKRA
jgi:hypothetical protein